MRGLWIRVCASAVMFMASVAILGYIIDQPVLYHWSGLGSGMALSTALCFEAIGFALYTMADVVDIGCHDEHCPVRRRVQ